MNWQKFWQKKSLFNFLLLPLSFVFYVITSTRRALYKKGLLKTTKVERPVIVIGNLNVGGAGKTPLVIALGELLKQRGIQYAVISKGYGGNFDQPTIVEKDSKAADVGDEPLLIKFKCDCPVIVAKSRIAAARLAIRTFPNIQIILTDDGLQHYQLARDINICVINDQIGLGNKWLLPAGGLREPSSQLENMDFVVYNGTPNNRYHYILAERGWHHIHNRTKCYPDEFSDDSNKNLALSGIAHPQLFFNRIQKMGINCKTLSLPDHYALSQKDLPIDKTLLMTEKDWVKAKELAHDDAWFLATQAQLSESFEEDFMIKIKQLIS